MKIKTILTSLCFGVIASSFTSCLDDAKNFVTGSYVFATVVYSEPGENKILEIDYDACFFSTETNAKDNYKKGDRVLIEQFTLDRDNQPGNATGEYLKPLQLSGVSSSKISTKDCILLGENESVDPNQDTLSMIMPPRISKSYLNTYYMTLGGHILKDYKTTYNLYYEGMSKDTMVFNFAINFQPTEEEVSTDRKVFYHSFVLPYIPAKQLIKVKFLSKGTSTSSSYYDWTKNSVTFTAPNYKTESDL